jgi:putative addiction module killer protein
MNTFLTTDTYDTWLFALKNNVVKARIMARIKSAENGNFGDTKPVGEGVHEMRVDIGPGYRVYYTRIGSVVFLLLCGGDKSTQKHDIKQAIAMRQELQEQQP